LCYTKDCQHRATQRIRWIQWVARWASPYPWPLHLHGARRKDKEKAERKHGLLAGPMKAKETNRVESKRSETIRILTRKRKWFAQVKLHKVHHLFHILYVYFISTLSSILKCIVNISFASWTLLAHKFTNKAFFPQCRLEQQQETMPGTWQRKQAMKGYYSKSIYTAKGTKQQRVPNGAPRTLRW